MAAFTLLVTADAFRQCAPEAELPILAASGEVRYPDRMGPLAAGELAPYLRAVDAVIAASDGYTAEALDCAPRLRAIVRWGTGWDTVDVAACTARGIAACNAPGMNIEAVADHALAAMLALARRLPHQIAVMRAGGWEEVRGVELFRKTVGIVGFGAIGQAVARRARGFSCRVLAFDPAVPPEKMRALQAEPAGLESLFAESDFVTLHAALTPESRGLVGAGLIGRMKPGAFLINTARGPLVDEEALAAALREGRIAGASLDAYADEPLPAGHLFRHLPNCLATPHSAFNTVETAAAVNAAVVEQVLALLRGERPRFPLNPEVLGAPHYRGRVPLLARAG